MKIKIKKFKKVRSTNDIALKLIKKNILEKKMFFQDHGENIQIYFMEKDF